MNLVENFHIKVIMIFDVLGSKAHRWLCYQYVLEQRVSLDALFLFHALFESQRPQTRPFVLHLQSTVDKLSSSYVMRFNVSTANLGRVNMDFGLFQVVLHKIQVVLQPFSDVKRMSNHSQSILVPFSSQSTIYKYWIY